MKRIIGLFVILVLILGGLAYYQVFKAPALKSLAHEGVIYIHAGDQASEVLAQLDLDQPALFGFIAKQKHYWSRIKPGRYRLTEDLSINALIDLLRSGAQEPTQLVLNQVRDLEDLAGVLGNQLMHDSSTFSQFFGDERFWAEEGLPRPERLGYFLPNTYEVYWTEAPEALYQRMKREAEAFWAQREMALANCALNRHEVLTLASIVESETARKDEMPLVAGLYLNRLEQGIKLQADPTVIFGVQQDYPDSVIRRVLFSHLRHPSAYNTYLHKGLPPGPIKLPQPAAIDAVLNAKQHGYIYMCADPDRPGYHAFAKGIREHNRNRAKYIRWLRMQRNS